MYFVHYTSDIIPKYEEPYQTTYFNIFELDYILAQNLVAVKIQGFEVLPMHSIKMES